YNSSDVLICSPEGKTKADAIRNLGTLIDNTKALMDIIATSIDPVGKATEIALSTTEGQPNYIWCSNPHTGDNADARGGVAALLDEDPNTFLHTNYTNKSTTHDYLQINFGNADGLTNFKIAGQHRADGTDDRPKNIEIYGSNDNSKWTSIATVTGLEDKAGFKWSSNAISADIKYVYLKFVVKTHDNENNVGRPWFHMAKFDLFKLTSTVEVVDEYKELGGITNEEAADVYDNLVNALYVYNNGGTADELQAAYNALEPLYSAVNEKKSKMEYVRELNELIPATNELIDAVTVSTTTGVPVALALTTTEGQPNYIWCNAPTANEGVGNLIDNDPGTILHTKWNAGAVGAYDHYLLITLGEEYKLANLKFRYKARTGNSNQMNMGDIPSGIKVYGSNEENGDYEELYTVSGLSQTSGYDWTSPAIDAKSYRYLRFNVTANSGFWHMAEFDLFKLIEVAPGYNTFGGITNDEVTAAYNNMVNAQALCSNGTATDLKAALNALRTSYETLNAKKGKVLNGVYHINFDDGNVFVAHTNSLSPTLSNDVAGYKLFDAVVDNSNDANKAGSTTGDTDASLKELQDKAIAAMAPADALFTIVPNNDFSGYTISAQGLYLHSTRNGGWAPLLLSAEANQAGVYLVEESSVKGFYRLKSNKNDIQYINDWGPVFGNDKSNKDTGLSVFSFTPVTEYTFNVTSVGMATLCLPFNVVLPQGMVAYDLAESKITQSGDVAYAYMDVIAEEGDVLKAGTPVIVKAEEGSYKLAITMDDTNAKGALGGSLLKGNFISQTLSQDSYAKKYIFANGANGVGFYLMKKSSGPIGANKCWMEWNVSAGQPVVRSFVISFDDATGISDIIPETKENSTHLIYNIGGQRLNKPQKGLNIIGNKKVIIK
ncbi:MAG: discoidin domain-containing protein, partial [Prevotellamassilia sp.]|nr:discoidin domain-containing protein [Prevotellamassilia sp.]